MPVVPQIILQTPLNTQSLRDIKPPLDVPQNLLSYILLGGLILAVIVGIVWLYIRKRHQTLPPPSVEEVNTQPAHEIALEQLKILETASYDMETYHTRISFVIREYIEARFQIPALELTTTGILHQMTREQISDFYIERIQQFLALMASTSV